jgi:mannitol-1-phosphate 5-dehydrogenase
MRFADRFFIDNLTPLLPQGFPLADMLGLIETSIGKMVPIMAAQDLAEDPLQVFAEPYNTLILDRKGFKNPIPQVKGLAPKDNIKAWVDRKLFIHNLGHAAAAYLGYRKNPEYVYMYEALDDPGIFLATRSAMAEAASVLHTMYPGDFPREDLLDHITDLLNRFRNRALGDTIYRVGCDLHRKLGPDDRFAAPLKAAIKPGLPCKHILDAMEAALSFRATDHLGNQLESDKQFISEAKKGLKHILRNVSGFTPDEVRQLLRKNDTK